MPGFFSRPARPSHRPSDLDTLVEREQFQYDGTRYKELYDRVINGPTIKHGAIEYQLPGMPKPTKKKIEHLNGHLKRIRGNRKNITALISDLTGFKHRVKSNDATEKDKRRYFNCVMNVWFCKENEARLLQEVLKYYEDRREFQLTKRQQDISGKAARMSLWPRENWPEYTTDDRDCLRNAEAVARLNWHNIRQFGPEALEDASDRNYRILADNVIATGSTIVEGIEDSSPRDNTQGVVKSIIESQKYYKALATYEHTADSHEVATLWCPATKQWHLREEVKLAHIMPQMMGDSTAAYLLGEYPSADVLWAARNFILLHYSIEELMDRGRIALIPLAETSEQSDSHIRIIVFDESALDEIVGRTAKHKPGITHRGETLRDLLQRTSGMLDFNPVYTGMDGLQTVMEVAFRPGKRNLYVRLILSFIVARQQGFSGWFSAVQAIEEKKLRVSHGKWFRQSVLHAMATREGFPELLSAFTNTFGESADAPRQSNLQETFDVDRLLELVAQIAIETGSLQDEGETSVTESEPTNVENVPKLTQADFPTQPRNISPTLIIHRPAEAPAGMSTPEPSIHGEDSQAFEPLRPAGLSVSEPGTPSQQSSQCHQSSPGQSSAVGGHSPGLQRSGAAQTQGATASPAFLDPSSGYGATAGPSRSSPRTTYSSSGVHSQGSAISSEAHSPRSSGTPPTGSRIGRGTKRMFGRSASRQVSGNPAPMKKSRFPDDPPARKFGRSASRQVSGNPAPKKKSRFPDDPPARI